MWSFSSLQSSDASTHGGHLYSDPFRFWRDRGRHFVHLGRYTDARDDEGCGNQSQRGRVLIIVCALRHTQASMTRAVWRQWAGSTSEAFGVQPRADRGTVSSRHARQGGLRNLSSRPCKWWVAALKCVGGGHRDRQLKCLAWRSDHGDVQRARDHRETPTLRPEQGLRMGLHEHVCVRGR